MNQYSLIFLWLLFAYLISLVTHNYKRTEIICGKKEIRFSPVIATGIILPLVYWAGIRTYDYFDTGSYALAFSNMPSTFGAIPTYIVGVKKDKGFYILSCIIRVIFGDNIRVYFMVLALIQALLLFGMLRKYSCNYIVSVFIFVASTDYLSWMHNGIRQFTAVTIILFATRYMLEKKYVQMIAFILFASLFHQSALLMIPIVFIVQGKAWNIRTILILVCTLLAITYIDLFTRILDQALTDTQYINVVSDWQSWQDDGTNPLRVLVYSIPTILSLVGMKYVKAEDNQLINMCVNMSVITVGLYIISMFTSGIFIGRLPIYTSIYSSCILLPWEIEHMFKKSSAIIVYIVMIIAYLVFYYYQVRLVWGIV